MLAIMNTITRLHEIKALSAMIIFAGVLVTAGDTPDKDGALFCLQCESDNTDIQCALGMMPATRCPKKANACLTFAGKTLEPGADYIIRSCVSNDLGDYCGDIPAPGGSGFNTDFCVKTCRSSNCNNESYYTIFKKSK